MSRSLSQKRKYEERLQLLTPHASSSTQHAPSSPSQDCQRILPSRQYARPRLNGEWFSIGRSSASNDLALPSNNRLVSRIHCRLRYLEYEDAFEIKCIGFNGVSLRISDQVIYVKRNTGVLVQLHDDCDLELNVAGSLVEIERPHEEKNETALLLPSSPVLAKLGLDNASDENMVDEVDSQAIALLQPLSPLPSSTGMMTPSLTPKSKRVRLDSPDTPLGVAVDAARHEVPLPDKSLRPRLIDFNSFNIPSAHIPQSETRYPAPGKENLPPAGLNVSPTCVEVIIKDNAVPEPSLPETDSAAFNSSTSINVASPATPLAEDAQEEQLDLKLVDQEFIDMLLTILATSLLSPAPISTLTPFFPADTKIADIESILRSQACVTEHVMTNEFSKKQPASSTWSYDANKDTDVLRMARLSSMQKPQRSLRPRTYQQMHTYEYEHSKYVMDCKAAGIKPVRFDGTRYRRTHSSQPRDA